MLLYYNKVFTFIAPAVQWCTHSEALRLGRFLRESMQLLHNWLSSEKVYKRECQTHPGFLKSMSNPKAGAITFPEFAKVNQKWQKKLISMFVKGLAKEYAPAAPFTRDDPPSLLILQGMTLLPF